MTTPERARFRMSTLRRLLCGSDKIPADFHCEGKRVEVPAESHDRFGFYRIGGYVFTVLTSAAAQWRPDGKRRLHCAQHRVFVHCPCCGKLIPAGRISQHEPSCAAKTTAAYDKAAADDGPYGRIV